MRINISKMTRWQQEELMQWFELKGYITHIIVKPKDIFLKIIK